MMPANVRDWLRDRGLTLLLLVMARRGVAIEIDGDPAPEDLDHTLASRALRAGCLLGLDSNAHTVGQLSYAERALAHARLAAIPAEKIINCWPLEQLLVWLADPVSVS